MNAVQGAHEDDVILIMDAYSSGERDELSCCNFHGRLAFPVAIPFFEIASIWPELNAEFNIDLSGHVLDDESDHVEIIIDCYECTERFKERCYELLGRLPSVERVQTIHAIGGQPRAITTAQKTSLH
jgi:hypothetical protein